MAQPTARPFKLPILRKPQQRAAATSDAAAAPAASAISCSAQQSAPELTNSSRATTRLAPTIQVSSTHFVSPVIISSTSKTFRASAAPVMHQISTSAPGRAITDVASVASEPKLVQLPSLKRRRLAVPTAAGPGSAAAEEAALQAAPGATAPESCASPAAAVPADIAGKVILRSRKRKSIQLQAAAVADADAAPPAGASAGAGQATVKTSAVIAGVSALKAVVPVNATAMPVAAAPVVSSASAGQIAAATTADASSQAAACAAPEVASAGPAAAAAVLSSTFARQVAAADLQPLQAAQLEGPSQPYVVAAVTDAVLQQTQQLAESPAVELAMSNRPGNSAADSAAAAVPCAANMTQGTRTAAVVVPVASKDLQGYYASAQLQAEGLAAITVAGLAGNNKPSGSSREQHIASACGLASATADTAAADNCALLHDGSSIMQAYCLPLHTGKELPAATPVAAAVQTSSGYDCVKHSMNLQPVPAAAAAVHVSGPSADHVVSHHNPPVHALPQAAAKVATKAAAAAAAAAAFEATRQSPEHPAKQPCLPAHDMSAATAAAAANTATEASQATRQSTQQVASQTSPVLPELPTAATAVAAAASQADLHPLQPHGKQPSQPESHMRLIPPTNLRSPWDVAFTRELPGLSQLTGRLRQIKPPPSTPASIEQLLPPPQALMTAQQALWRNMMPRKLPSAVQTTSQIATINHEQATSAAAGAMCGPDLRGLLVSLQGMPVEPVDSVSEGCDDGWDANCHTLIVSVAEQKVGLTAHLQPQQQQQQQQSAFQDMPRHLKLNGTMEVQQLRQQQQQQQWHLPACESGAGWEGAGGGHTHAAVTESQVSMVEYLPPPKCSAVTASTEHSRHTAAAAGCTEGHRLHPPGHRMHPAERSSQLSGFDAAVAAAELLTANPAGSQASGRNKPVGTASSTAPEAAGWHPVPAGVMEGYQIDVFVAADFGDCDAVLSNLASLIE